MPTRAIGSTRWAIAEGYIPAGSTGPAPQMTSHETDCILSAGERDAEVRITVLFADREPSGPYRIRVTARRTRHVRFNGLTEPEPAVAQHTRLDSRQEALALLSTLAFAANGSQAAG